MRCALLVALLAVPLLGGPAQAEQSRGVSPCRLPRYQGEVFACLDGSTQLPSGRVNDEYCDCADGSDEPGTSACAFKFYCLNERFRGHYIFSSRVNDGICDCCDGSDEYKSSAQCPDVCAERAQRLFAEVEETTKTVRQGLEIRGQYVAAAAQALADAREHVEEARVRLGQLQEEAKAAEARVAAEEAQERADKAQLAQAQRGRLLVALGLATMSSEEKDDLLLRHLLEGASIRGELDKRVAAPQAESEAVITDTGDVEEAGEEEEEAAAGGSSAADAAIAEYRAFEHKRPEAEAARDALRALRTRLEDARGEVEVEERLLATDFGPDAAFHGLYEQCYKSTVAKYGYEVCPYKSARQDSVSLGTWKGWGDNYRTMEFTDGQRCWNGPARSLTVRLECGTKNEVLAVDEPSTCVYEMRFATPAACDKAVLEHVHLGAQQCEGDEEA